MPDGTMHHDLCVCMLPGSNQAEEASLWGNSNTTLLNVYSALHDVLKGEIRIYIELYPEELCSTIVSCAFPGSDVAEAAAVTELPYPKLLPEAMHMPEPRECIVTCTLPAKQHAANVSEVVLIENHGNRPISCAVERTRVLKQKKGLGICMGPVYTDTPQWLVCSVCTLHALASMAFAALCACMSSASEPCCLSA
jgi:hypothetical protein